MASITSTHVLALRRLLNATALGDREAIGDLVTDDIVGWSPHLFVTSRQQLLETVTSREQAFSAVDVDITAVDEVGDKAIAEWHISADHTGTLVIDDDLLVEPTSRRLHLSGATFAEFDGERICAFRHYFDDLALVEQALAVDG